LVGSPSDIDRRIAMLAGRDGVGPGGAARQVRERFDRIAGHDSDAVEDVGDVRSPLSASGPPPLPERLSAAQAAELAELLDYVQGVLRRATEAAVLRPGQDRVEVELAEWQAVLDMQGRLAELLRGIGDPHGS